MSIYSTIWDGSDWATEGGTYPVDYRFAPFVASYTILELDGCVWNPPQSTPLCSYTCDPTNPIYGPQFSGCHKENKNVLGKKKVYNIFINSEGCNMIKTLL